MIIKTKTPLDCQIEINNWTLYIWLEKALIKLKLEIEQERAILKQINNLELEKTIEVADLPF